MAVTAITMSPANGTSNANSNFARGGIESDSFTLPTSAANAKGFDFRGFSGGSIEVAGACTIQWYRNMNAAHQAGTTPIAARDSEGALIPDLVFAGAGEAELPISLFGKPWIYPISNNAVAATVFLKK